MATTDIEARLDEAGERWRNAVRTTDTAPSKVKGRERAIRRPRRGIAIAGMAALVVVLMTAALTYAVALHHARLDQPISTPSAAVPAPNGVTGVVWRLRSASHNNSAVAVPPQLYITFSLTNQTYHATDSCNSHSGTARLTPTTINLATPSASTQAACTSDLTTTIQAVLLGTVTWTVSEGVLTIDRPGAGTLQYRQVVPRSR